jgi:hypothetical protein
VKVSTWFSGLPPRQNFTQPARACRGQCGSARTAVSLLIYVGLLSIAGCRSESKPGAEEEEEHAGHVIPAHKPKSFPEAVHRLTALSERIVRQVAAGQTRALVDNTTLPIALDIVLWLPEIAADSDLPEPIWDEVAKRSADLVTRYQAVLRDTERGGAHSAAGVAAKDAARTIADLEAVLAKSDPRWFDDKAEKKVTRLEIETAR